MAAPVASAPVTANATNAATVNISGIATLSTNYILVLAVYNENHGVGVAATVTSVTSSGMTWARRKRSNSSLTGCLELWWARGTVAISSYVVTMNFSGSYDDCSAVVFVVTGCADPTAPFDINASLPAALSAPTATWTPSFTGINTSSTDDLLLFVTGTIGGGITAATGFTEIIRTGNPGGAWASAVKVDGRSVTALQVSATFTHGSALTSPFGSVGGEAIFDALAGNLPAASGAAVRVMVLA